MADRNELALIDWIRQQARSAPGLQLGIGDDAAVWQVGDKQLLLTTDVLMENVDFLLPPPSNETVGRIVNPSTCLATEPSDGLTIRPMGTLDATARLIGRKAMAVNLSDIAAMAGRPLTALVGVALPRSRGFEFARELHQGLQSLADEFHVAIIGGDTNIWDGPLVISVTVIGEATDRGPVRRCGAKPGDWIFVTGPLGGSITGEHLTFTPRVREALELHSAVDLHAMIDLSDGLSSDLYHILDESHVGATLIADAIPITDSARQMTDGRTPLDHALADGEDFELLFTVSSDDGRRLLSGQSPIAVFHIGEIAATVGCQLRHSNGSVMPLPCTGWEHSF